MCWAACAAADFDGAVVYGDRAAAAFDDANAGFDADDVLKQERERTARKHLTRARIHTLAGRAADAAVDVDAGLELVSHEGKRVVWHSTIDALQALKK